jgi:phytoene synthase
VDLEAERRRMQDPELSAAYALCKAIHRKYDPSFYAGCLMLPPIKRPYVDALYAQVRMFDQIVDDPTEPDVAVTAARLDERVAAYELALKVGDSPDPVLKAAAHTALTWDIPIEHFYAFSDTMRSDLTVTEYATYDDLLGYMYGATSLLGPQLVPILGPLDPSAAERSIAIGYALQLTNILRDIDEDLGRGRLYLPREDLDTFGATRADFEARTMTDGIRALLKFETERARAYFAEAHAAATLLHPSSRESVGTGLILYAGILDSLEQADYQVFGVRHGFSKLRALRIAVPAYIRARRSWRG